MAGVTLGRQAGSIAGTYAWASIVGTAIHAYLEEAFAWDASPGGGNPGRWLTEHRVTPDPGASQPHPGTADLFDTLYFSTNDHKCQSEAMRIRLRRDGPPRHYFIQLLLYAVGYMNEGRNVQRIVLISWPRTLSTLDDLYIWEHVITADDLRLVLAELEKTETREQLAKFVAAGELSFWDVPPTPSSGDCEFCLGGETEVVTRQGLRPIAELAAAGSAELLVPSLDSKGYKGRGMFREVPVRQFGEQELLEITLKRSRRVKTIRATAEHRWLVMTERPGKPGRQEIKNTSSLAPGDRLKQLRRARISTTPMMDFAVAQGFVFGDGTKGSEDRWERPATLTVYNNGKDEAMLRFFPPGRIRTQANGIKVVDGLPRFWKALPPIAESRSFLLSWLAGYFAADGSVSRAGQCVLSSADKESLEFVRNLAAVCGVGYGQVRTRLRKGINQDEPSELHVLNLRRRDLPPWFFLIGEHAKRAAANTREVKLREQDLAWSVVSVERTGLVEPVYCAVVEGEEAFALADDLMTMNCPFSNPAALQDGTNQGCPGMSLKSARAYTP
jgi:hypothetical protein